MSNIKCSACGTIWNVANPSAAKKSSAAREQESQDSEDVSDSTEGVSPGLMITIAGGVLALLVLLGVGVAVMSGSTKKPAATEQPTTAQPTEKVKLVYRIVKLPEDQRKKIYYDYRLAAGSSVEKKVFLPKDSAARRGLESTMGAIVKRELTQLALIHKISDDDIQQIILEGQDKDWPPRRAPATP